MNYDRSRIQRSFRALVDVMLCIVADYLTAISGYFVVAYLAGDTLRRDQLIKAGTGLWGKLLTLSNQG